MKIQQNVVKLYIVFIPSLSERSLHTFSYLYLLSVLSLAVEKIIARTLEPLFFILRRFSAEFEYL